MNRRGFILAAIAALAITAGEADAQRRRRSPAERPRRSSRGRSGGGRRSAGSFGAVGGGTYRSCAEARAAGAAPLRQGDDGYSTRLDRDRDGVACE